MANTLTYSGTTLTLPVDLQWSDEYAWQPVELKKTYTLTGALVAEAYAKQSGRPITLGGDISFGWFTRAQLDQVQAWAAVPGRTFSLVLRDEAARTVAFDCEAGAVDAQQINFDYDSTAAGDVYAVKLRFFEV